MNAFRRPFTVWRFTGVSIPQVVVVAKPTEPREYQNEYSQILGVVMAYNPSDALAMLARRDAWGNGVSAPPAGNESPAWLSEDR